MSLPTPSPGPARCPICGDVVPVAPHPCERCETPHHSECWDYNEGCGVYGCKASLEVVEAQAVALFLEDDDELALGLFDYLAAIPAGFWRVLGLGCTLAGLSLLTTFGAHPAFLGWPFLLFLAPTILGFAMVVGANAFPAFLRMLTPRPVKYLDETPLKRLEARLGEDPKNRNTLELVAYLYFAQERFEDALELYEQSLAILDRQYRISYQRAKCLERLGRDAEALAAFEALTSGHDSDDIQRKAAWWVTTLRRRGRDDAVSAAGSGTSGSTPPPP